MKTFLYIRSCVDRREVTRLFNPRGMSAYGGGDSETLLLVGEGRFSFSVELLKHLRSNGRRRFDNVYTSCYEAEATTPGMLANIDALKSSECADKLPVALRSTKGKSKNPQVKHLVDVRRIRAIGGNGGDGCVSFLQLWANDKAGPDGGDGGNGGHVLLRACSNTRDLDHVNSVARADCGEKGYNKNCNGKNAEHTIIKVPLGTLVKENTTGQVIGDLQREGDMFVLARGGAGGHGNAFFAGPTQQAPVIAQYGATGEDLPYVLELRTIAHFGLLGMPNAGKSTLLQAISRARPKVASYPFTTLKPHIGIVHYEDYLQIAVADLPGLIEGSHLNRGLGIQFLRHADRCPVLVLVVDVVNDPVSAINMLRHELLCFDPDLASRPQLVIANKMDLTGAEDNLAELMDSMKGTEVIAVSAKYGKNISALLQLIRKIYEESIAEKDKKEDVT